MRRFPRRRVFVSFLLVRVVLDREQDVREDKALWDYSNDRLLRRAIERNLEVIGETVGRSRRDDPETADRLTAQGRMSRETRLSYNTVKKYLKRLETLASNPGRG